MDFTIHLHFEMNTFGVSKARRRSEYKRSNFHIYLGEIFFHEVGTVMAQKTRKKKTTKKKATKDTTTTSLPPKAQAKTVSKKSKPTKKTSTKQPKKTKQKPSAKKTKKKRSKKTSKPKKTSKSKKSIKAKTRSKNLKGKKKKLTSPDLVDEENLLEAEADSDLITIDENLQKLITPEEREKMEENLDLVVCYLEDIGIVDLNVDREKLIITVPFDYEEFSFLSHIVLSPEWILIKTSIFELDQLSEMSIFNLFAEILKGNFILNSVVYALDPEHKSIWAQADIPISSSFDTFKLNYFSIVFAIDYFMKNISPKANLQLKSTLDREEFKKSPSHLYI